MTPYNSTGDVFSLLAHTALPADFPLPPPVTLVMRGTAIPKTSQSTSG